MLNAITWECTLHLICILSKFLVLWLNGVNQMQRSTLRLLFWCFLVEKYIYTFAFCILEALIQMYVELKLWHKTFNLGVLNKYRTLDISCFCHSSFLVWVLLYAETFYLVNITSLLYLIWCFASVKEKNYIICLWYHWIMCLWLAIQHRFLAWISNL